MSGELFGGWLKYRDDDLASQGRKVCLLFGSCSAHNCKRLVQRLLENLRTGRELIDLLGAITMLNVSWNDVKKETIQNLFCHFGLCISGEAGTRSLDNNNEPFNSQLSEFPGVVCDCGSRLCAR